jgi:hypothetical protein
MCGTLFYPFQLKAVLGKNLETQCLHRDEGYSANLPPLFTHFSSKQFWVKTELDLISDSE